MPGALAAMAAVLCSGRTDWWPLIPYFAMFGALGWSFGGSISYMQVVGYTHSSHSGTVLYGFANLFVIGFCWAFLGGAGTALPACMHGSELSSLFVPLIAVFLAWIGKDVVEDRFFSVPSDRRHESLLYWYDTDWLAAVTAFGAALAVAAFRGRVDAATSLVFHLSAGWFLAFFLLVPVLQIRMTPPRGDNWAGCVGMTGGLLLWCRAYGMDGVACSAWTCGLIGGIGFALAQFLKLVFIKSGRETNWHSVLEQTQGLFHGVALALALGRLVRYAPVVPAFEVPAPWTRIFAVLFVLVVLTYLNHRKAVPTWVKKVETLPERVYGLYVSGYLKGPGVVGWLELFYGAIGVAVFFLARVHLRKGLPLVPQSLLGQGQLLYLVFLWWIVAFNFERAIVGFAPKRIVTEGVVSLNAVLCSALLLLGAGTVLPRSPVSIVGAAQEFRLGPTVILGFFAMAVSTVAFWCGKRRMYGDDHVPYASLHIRFGPERTAVKEKPKAGELHP